MLKSVFGLSVKYETWNRQDSLPLYITGNYNFHSAIIGNQRCLMLAPIEKLASTPALKKQISKIRKVDDVPIVFELSSISDYRRRSLIENNISFITEKQAFLPFVGAMLMDEKEKRKPVEKFMFSTQLLLLYYLYNQSERLYLSEAGKALPFSAMTMSRAVRQLEDSLLFHSAKDGVKKFIESVYNPSELFEKAKGYLSSPIRLAGYIDKTLIMDDMVFSGETALSEETMLNPGRVAVYAAEEKNFDKTQLTDELIDPDRQVRLELWAYNPRQFSNGNNVDDLSLVLSLKDTDDERIEEALDELTERRLKETWSTES